MRLPLVRGETDSHQSHLPLSVSFLLLECCPLHQCLKHRSVPVEAHIIPFHLFSPSFLAFPESKSFRDGQMSIKQDTSYLQKFCCFHQQLAGWTAGRINKQQCFPGSVYLRLLHQWSLRGMAFENPRAVVIYPPLWKYLDILVATRTVLVCLLNRNPVHMYI